MKTYTLVLNEPQLAVIDEALCGIAYGRAAPVVNEINEQIKKQIEKKEESRPMRIIGGDPHPIVEMG